MNRLSLLAKSLLGAAVMSVGLCCALAQEPEDQPPQAPPKPAARAIPPIGAEDQADAQQDVLQPDDRPLTGLQQTTIGSPSERHSYWIVGASYNNLIQSNGRLQGGGDGWNSNNFVGGTLSLLQNWSNAQLGLNYSGGGSFSTDKLIGTGFYQQLGANQTFRWERWQLTFLDQFSYLPSSQFGFGAGSGLSTPGVGGPLSPGTPGLPPGIGGGQSVFSGVGPQYNNAGGVQTSYQFTRRSKINLGAVYSIQRFTESGNIASDTAILNAGYDFQLNRTDTLGFVYQFISYHFSGDPQAIGDHVVQLAYGHKITGRLALQAAGGVEMPHYRVAIGTSKSQVNPSGNVGLNYGLPRGALNLTYSHGTSAGSGVLAGAITDRVQFGAQRQLSRIWSGNANFGFAHNRGIEGNSGIQGQTYDAYFLGAGVSRPLGRTANFSLSYTAYIENSNEPICTGTVCQTNYTTHQINVGLSWHTRPMVIH